jgi:uncharacterized repeat protein (TIGR02543 family)
VNKPADPEKPGYTFNGWFSAESGGTKYGWPHTLSDDVTMHAQWLDNNKAHYTITFDPHGGSAVEALTGEEGTGVDKPADPERPGYTFNGWFSAESGGTKYGWPHTLNDDVTMHAQWTIVTYNISYTLNGGTNAAANPPSYTVTELPISLAAASREGYTFGGWYGDADFSGTAVTSIPAGTTGHKTLYARWTIASYDKPVTLTIDFTDPGAGLVTEEPFTLTRPGGTITITVTGGMDAAWYLGAARIGTGNSVTLSADTLSPGSHTLEVTAKYDGVRYSRELTFTVVE